MVSHMQSRMKSRIIGFSRRIRYEWLEHAAELCVAVGNAPESEVNTVSWDAQVTGRIRQGLREYLAHQMCVPVDVPSESRDKAATLLSRIWSSVPSDVVMLRDEALELYARVSEPERLALHWGMVIAVYPFVFEMAEVVGRLLRLQKTFRLSQVRERIEDIAGQRPTVYHAVPKVIRSFVDWRVLASPLDGTGVYSGTEPLHIHDETLLAWLVEAMLHAKSAPALPLVSLVNSPGLFPFFIEPGSTTDYVIRKNPRLTVFRQGVSEVMVGLL